MIGFILFLVVAILALIGSVVAEIVSNDFAERADSLRFWHYRSVLQGVSITAVILSLGSASGRFWQLMPILLVAIIAYVVSTGD